MTSLFRPFAESARFTQLSYLSVVHDVTRLPDQLEFGFGSFEGRPQRYDCPVQRPHRVQIEEASFLAVGSHSRGRPVMINDMTSRYQAQSQKKKRKQLANRTTRVQSYTMCTSYARALCSRPQRTSEY